MLERIWYISLLTCLLGINGQIRVDTNNSLFMDQYGRYRVYHGVNVVYKVFPFYPDLHHFSPDLSLTQMDLENLEGWGFNMIRLHVAWEGVEKEKGIYNYTYVEKLLEIVRMCNKYNIMVLLDAHQDVINRKFCGEGFPDWTVQPHSFPRPLKVQLHYDQDGYPLLEDCKKLSFAEYYLTYDVMKFQQDFFTNQRSLLDHFAKMWQLIAVYMKNQPNLLGYQIMNEPVGSNMYGNPQNLLQPGVADNKFLFPAYEKIYNAIREKDSQNLIFYEQSLFDIVEGGGFYESLGSEQEKAKQVISYHQYCPNGSEPLPKTFCKFFDSTEIAMREAEIERLRVGGFLTEFGAMSGSIKTARQLTSMADILNQYFRSWSYWQFKAYNDITTTATPPSEESFYDEHGNIQQHKLKALARPYAYAICGTPIKQSFQNGIYELIWLSSSKCFNQPTEIFLSQAYHFSNGFDTQFKGCHGCNLLPLKDHKVPSYYSINLPENRKEGSKVSLIIKPK